MARARLPKAASSKSGPAKPGSLARGVSLDAVWKLGVALPGVEMSTTFGAPALKVKGAGGKMQVMACVPTNKAAEPGSLLVRVDREKRAQMLAESPDLYYAPEHYLGYDGVLVRLERIDAERQPELLRDLLAMAHHFVTGKRAKG